MIKASQFFTVAVNAVAFTPDISAFKPGAVLASAMGQFSKLFTGEISVIPLPDEVPPEINRVELKSEDGAWSLMAAPARIGASWTSQSANNAPPPLDVVKQCADILTNHFAQNDSIQVNRLAFVITRTAVVNEPSGELIGRFCNPNVADQGSALSPLRNSKGFQIHNLKQYPIDDGIQLNSWVRCKTGKLTDGSNTPIVVFEQDLNTEVTENVFAPNKIGPFFTRVEAEANKILALYFPEVQANVNH